MMNIATIAAGMPAPDFRTRMEKHDALNSDIIQTIHKNYHQAVSQVSEVAGHFKGHDHFDTAGNIWHFLRYKIAYKADPQDHQKVRLPNRFVIDGIGDCKSLSLFAASILGALGMPVAFRYASYTHSSIPTHVYVVTKDEDGRDIIIDGVWKHFNAEKEYCHKKDYTMQVSTLSGIGSKAKRLARKQKRQERREERKEKREERKKEGNFFQRAGKDIKKVALAPGRAAFLGLVALNVHGFASSLKKVLSKSRTKTMWEKLGGNFDKLAKTVESGAKKKRILGVDEYLVSGIGEPVSAAALAATAAPIIAIVVKFLKGEGVSDSDLQGALNTAKTDLEATGQAELPDNLSTLNVTDAEQKSLFGGGGSNKIIIIGGAALIGLFLISKRK